jgi:hypothetical protein
MADVDDKGNSYANGPDGGHKPTAIAAVTVSVWDALEGQHPSLFAS